MPSLSPLSFFNASFSLSLSLSLSSSPHLTSQHKNLQPPLQNAINSTQRNFLNTQTWTNPKHFSPPTPPTAIHRNSSSGCSETLLSLSPIFSPPMNSSSTASSSPSTSSPTNHTHLPKPPPLPLRSTNPTPNPVHRPTQNLPLPF